MKYENYKRMSVEDKEQYDFDNRNNRVEPVGAFYKYFIMYNTIMITVLATFMLMFYDNGKYGYLVQNIIPMMMALMILAFVVVADMVIVIFNIFYRHYKERKLLRKYDKKNN